MHLNVAGLDRHPNLLHLSVKERSEWLLSLRLNSSPILPERFSRNRECFYRCDDFELIVVTWGIDSKTEIHSHGESECSFVVLAGTLTERLYDSETLSLYDERTHTAGDCSTITSGSISHAIESTHGALSVHLYAKPLAMIPVFTGGVQTQVMRGPR